MIPANLLFSPWMHTNILPSTRLLCYALIGGGSSGSRVEGTIKMNKTQVLFRSSSGLVKERDT